MTEKWVIGGTGGELAIGLFTMKDVAAGTELTFDYNFERQGDKVCVCVCRLVD
jgi:histone-lysine N-methyltransferase SETD2